MYSDSGKINWFEVRMKTPAKTAQSKQVPDDGGLAAGKTAGEIISNVAGSGSGQVHAANVIEGASRLQRIAVSAYLRAKDRGFTAGNELDDWLAAEREIDAQGP
jgi:hypothetical protein